MNTRTLSTPKEVLVLVAQFAGRPLIVELAIDEATILFRARELLDQNTWLDRGFIDELLLQLQQGTCPGQDKGDRLWLYKTSVLAPAMTLQEWASVYVAEEKYSVTSSAADEVLIDQEPMTWPGDGGTWVNAWLFVRERETKSIVAQPSASNH